MAKILIIDDNRSTSALLKRALAREDHQIRIVADWKGLWTNIEDPTVDLVLFHRDDSQWTAFNRFKSTHQDIPAMLYVMQEGNSTGTVWIVKAVQEALAQKYKLDTPRLYGVWAQPAKGSLKN